MKKKIKDCSYQEIKNYCFNRTQCDDCIFRVDKPLHIFCVYAHQVGCKELNQEIEVEE